MRATATLTAADFRPQESGNQPLQPTLTTLFDGTSHHDRHHARSLAPATMTSSFASPS
jgi:hypothetical protein